MAESKRTASYFSHDSNARNSDRLIKVRMKYGALGYGVYFMILERLRDDPRYMSVRDYNMIAFDLRVDSSVIKSVVEDFGLFVFTEDGEYFYSEGFMRRMDLKDNERQKRSAAGKRAMATRWGTTTDKSVITELPENDKSVIRVLSDSDKSVITELPENDKSVIRVLSDSDKSVITELPENDNKKSKVKESKVKDDGVGEKSPSTASPAEVDNLATDLNELRKESGWINLVAMKFGMSVAEVVGMIADFELDCRVNGKMYHQNLSDVKSHFANWLRIQRKKETNHAGSEQDPAAAEAKHTRRRGTDVAATSSADYSTRL